MKVLVVYNPAAGGGREARLRRFLAALELEGLEVEVHRTRAPGDATAHLCAREWQGDVVVAVGGDGTTSEVINGLAPGVPLAVFATGTANVLGRELELPVDPREAARVIAARRTLDIWPGRLDGRRFIMWVGIGYDAWVVNTVDLRLKARIGKGAYAVAMLRQIARYGSCRFRLEIDGHPHECLSAVVANGRLYGGSFVLSQQANLARPGLQVLLFQRPGRGFLLRCLLALLFGRMERVPGVQSLAARSVQVTADGDEPLQADGDPAGRLPAVIVADEVPVPVVVPERTLKRYAAAVAGSRPRPL